MVLRCFLLRGGGSDGKTRKWFVCSEFCGNTSSNLSTNGVVVVCGGGVVFCMEDVDSRQ
jgi:hypothetical protein